MTREEEDANLRLRGKKISNLLGPRMSMSLVWTEFTEKTINYSDSLRSMTAEWILSKVVRAPIMKWADINLFNLPSASLILHGYFLFFVMSTTSYTLGQNKWIRESLTFFFGCCCWNEARLESWNSGHLARFCCWLSFVAAPHHKTHSMRRYRDVTPRVDHRRLFPTPDESAEKQNRKERNITITFTSREHSNELCAVDSLKTTKHYSSVRTKECILSIYYVDSRCWIHWDWTMSKGFGIKCIQYLSPFLHCTLSSHHISLLSLSLFASFIFLFHAVLHFTLL